MSNNLTQVISSTRYLKFCWDLTITAKIHENKWVFFTPGAVLCNHTQSLFFACCNFLGEQNAPTFLVESLMKQL